MGVPFIVWFPTVVCFVGAWEYLRYLINKHG